MKNNIHNYIAKTAIDYANIAPEEVIDLSGEVLGCTAAYNLDGGQSSVIAYRSFFNRNGFPIG